MLKGGNIVIGRVSEKSVIEDCLRSNRAEFLVVYGRRRVGKTFLIKEYFHDTFSFYATGVSGTNTRTQLRAFAESLIMYGDAVKTVPKDWFEAFARLRSILSSPQVTKEYEFGKMVVFLDELPWMDTARSNFKSALDYFWNSWGSAQKNLLFIVCGSATSWIINNIVRDSAGFYNRITRQIHLMPFTLNECEKLLVSNGMRMTRKQVIECYMIFGGIPYYLNYLKPQLSLAQNVELLFFRENSPLRYEFDQLFSSLFKKADHHIEIIEELSKVRNGLTRSELIRTGKIVEGKELTKCLTELEQCGFIRKYYDFTRSENGGIYQLIDSLTLFCLTFMQNRKIESWIEFLNSPAYYNWCGLAFERVCLQHILQIKKELGISGISSSEFSWRSKNTTPGAQIDLLIDRKDDVINVWEMKFSAEPFTIDATYEKALIHKMEAFRSETKTRKALLLTMISLNGLSENQYKNTVANVLTGDDLFTE